MKKDRQYNGQMKKDRQYNGQMKRDKEIYRKLIKKQNEPN